MSRRERDALHDALYMWRKVCKPMRRDWCASSAEWSNSLDSQLRMHNWVVDG